MLGFPPKTELKKQLPKTAIYAKFNLNQPQQDRFDADISRLYIVNEVSTFSTNIPAGESVKSFHVIHVLLKKADYDEKNIAMLFRLIDSNIILVLEYEGNSQVVIFCNRLIKTDWQPTDTLSYSLDGLDLDAVWNNLILQIGNITLTDSMSVGEQLAINDHRAKLEKEIARLEKQARAEKQPKKKFELVSQVRTLKKQHNELG